MAVDSSVHDRRIILGNPSASTIPVWTPDLRYAVPISVHNQAPTIIKMPDLDLAYTDNGNGLGLNEGDTVTLGTPIGTDMPSASLNVARIVPGLLWITSEQATCEHDRF